VSILVEDIALCLSIILKWNKIYTVKHNYLVLYSFKFNLNKEFKLLKCKIVVFDEVYILFHFIMICVRVDYLPWREWILGCVKLLIRRLFCRTDREMVLFCHSYCTKMITYFARTYLFVELRDVSLHSCRIRLTVILVSTSELGFRSHSRGKRTNSAG